MSFVIDLDLTNDRAMSGSGPSAPEVPPGDYVVDVLAADLQTSKAGNSMIVVDFQVAEGEFEGKKCRNYYVLTEKARGRWKNLAIACGETDFTQVKGDSVIGARLMISVKHEQGNVKITPDGRELPPLINVSIFNERAIEVAAPPPPPPPATKKATANGAVRRA